MKKWIALFLITVMCITSFVCGQKVNAANAGSGGLEAGDIIYFGSYPQTQVTDATLIAKLDAVSKTWNSYPYYVHNPSCLMDRGEYADRTSSYRIAVSKKDTTLMKYSDFTYNDQKYRAVRIQTYLNKDIAGTKVGNDWVLTQGYQQSNGYALEQVYYFAYEPLSWTVLDTETGLILCNQIIDTQPFNATYSITNGQNRPVWKSAIDSQYDAGLYVFSTVRHWLNAFTSFDDAYGSFNFVKTAFSTSEQLAIQYHAYSFSLANNQSVTADDRVFLLSEADVRKYSSLLTRANGTDYARSQGIETVGAGNGIPWYTCTSFQQTDLSDQLRLKTVNYQSPASGVYGSLTSLRTGLRPAVTVKLTSGYLKSIKLSSVETDTGKPSLSWTSIVGATSYKVYRALDDYAPTSALAWETYPIASLSSNTTTFTDSNVPTGKTYYYRIVADTVYGDLTSNYVETKCRLEKPDLYQIGNVIAKGVPVLGWRTVTDAAKYEIYHMADYETEWSLLDTVSADTVGYEDTNAMCGRKHSYKIKAISAKGSDYNSPFSQERTVKCILPTPKNVTVEINDEGDPVISWDRVDSASGYRLRYFTTDDSLWKEIYIPEDNTTGIHPGRTEVVLTEVIIGKVHEYELRAAWTKESSTYSSMSVDGSFDLTYDPIITEQPADVKVEATDIAQFTVDAKGVAPFTYQWQSRKNASSGWANSGQSGAKTRQLNVTTNVGLHGWQFRCIVTDADGRSTPSEAATLSLIPKFTTQPKNTKVAAGDTAQFTVAVTAKANVSYQWQSRKDSSSTWTNSGQSGARTATLSVTTNAGLHGWQFRCIVTDGNGQKNTSKVAKLTLTPKISKQPKSTYAAAGSTAKFTITASGKANLSYQWQSRKDDSSEWVNSGQNGARSATLSVTVNAGLNGYQFRCVVTDGNGQTATSKVAILYTKLSIKTQPKDASVAAGETANFSVEAYGKATLKYQWQSRKNASSEWGNSGQDGAKTATLSVATNAGLNGWQFRCIVTDGNGQKITTTTAILNIVPKITKQPANTSVKAGEKAKFTISATGTGTLKYQWQSRKNSSAEWVNSGQSGAKTATLTVSTNAGLSGYQFRCIVTDGNGQKKESNAATLTVTK